MDKAPTADKALAPAAAMDHAVNGGQKIAAAQASTTDRLDLGGAARLAHSVNRARVGGQQVIRGGVIGATAQLGLEAGVGAHLGQETGHRTGVIAGPGEIANTQGIGLEFLIPAIAAKVKRAAQVGQIAGRSAACHRAQNAGAEPGQHLPAIALGRMTGRHMANFMGQNTGQLGLIAGQGDQSARHIDIPAGQGEGVDNRRVQHGEMKAVSGIFGMGGEFAADAGDIVGQAFQIVGATELPADFGVFLGA